MAVTFSSLLAPSAVVAQAVEHQAEEVDQVFAEGIDSDSPGAAVAVVRNGQVVFTKGYGLANLEYDVRVTPATAFNFGSVTKQFTAFAVAMLIEQGKLSVDDEIRKYLPEMGPLGSSIKIKHLLHHTSGLRDEINLLSMAGYGLDDAIMHDHVLRLITNQKELLFKPGERWEYSNSGYTLLAEIVTRLSGQAFEEWMEQNVFVPLGMNRTRFLYDLGTIIKDRAYSYLSSPEGCRRSVISKSNVGCGNLFSTAEDMAKWAANFANAKVGGRSVIDRMSETGVLNDGTVTDYAYGQFVGERLAHGGQVARVLALQRGELLFRAGQLGGRVLPHIHRRGELADQGALVGQGGLLTGPSHLVRLVPRAHGGQDRLQLFISEVEAAQHIIVQADLTPQAGDYLAVTISAADGKARFYKRQSDGTQTSLVPASGSLNLTTDNWYEAKVVPALDPPHAAKPSARVASRPAPRGGAHSAEHLRAT